MFSALDLWQGPSTAKVMFGILVVRMMSSRVMGKGVQDCRREWKEGAFIVEGRASDRGVLEEGLSNHLEKSKFRLNDNILGGEVQFLPFQKLGKQKGSPVSVFGEVASWGSLWAGVFLGCKLLCIQKVVAPSSLAQVTSDDQMFAIAGED